MKADPALKGDSPPQVKSWNLSSLRCMHLLQCVVRLVSCVLWLQYAWCSKQNKFVCQCECECVFNASLQHSKACLMS
jgi:hypothetical protein